MEALMTLRYVMYGYLHVNYLPFKADRFYKFNRQSIYGRILLKSRVYIYPWKCVCNTIFHNNTMTSQSNNYFDNRYNIYV